MLRTFEVTMDWKPFITADPQIMHGTVCFRGTRVPVSVVPRERVVPLPV